MNQQRSRTAIAAIAVAIAVVAFSATAAAGANRSLGVDVSRFDGTINWNRVPVSGVKFAFVEASRGSGSDCAVKPRRCGADPSYRLNYSGARANGIRVGAYHRAFVDGETRAELNRDARAEARLFTRQVGRLRGGDLLPVLDVETPFGGAGPDDLCNWIRIWLKRVRERLGEKPIIYTNVSSWQATGNTTRFARAGHPLWVANWGVLSPMVPARDWAGRGWSVWQFTNNADVKGIPGLPDADRLGVRLGKISVR